MPTLLDLASELVAQIPGLPMILSRKYINQAIDFIERDYLWSWNVNEGILICPAAVSTGAVAVTQFSNSIQFDSTARAALDPLATSNPPLNLRQFRASGTGPVYNLIGYDTDTGIGTLDRIYTEATDSASTYTIYRCYYGPPSINGTVDNIDFRRYIVILNPINGYAIAGKRLRMTRQELQRRDPMRGALGLPYYAATYRPQTNGLVNGQLPTGPSVGIMQYELWPHPTYQLTLQALYERQHVDLAPSDYLPNQAPISTIRYKAQEFAYRWAMANVGRIPELRGANWAILLKDAQTMHQVDLVQAKRNDKEILTTIINSSMANNMNFIGPIDSNFFQDHGLPSLV